ncbi:MAG: protein kinase, partial [Planctomycetaceae bacterium]|nr:protein kinase [Planctomycetaceae bacterium]
GMGVVYMARQAAIDRTVALKMLKPGTENNTDARSKFLSEACVTGDLEHPNIVPIYDLGRDSSGAYFYAMKRVQGTPWKDVIADKSLHENLEILMRVADAVAFAHSKGIIHRDLKPENIMLGEFGEVLVMDWGLAMPVDLERRFGGIRQLPDIGGTPAYMAPEMVLGPLPAIGVHSDVYLLGAILYEIATGLRPHKSSDKTSCVQNAANNKIQPTEKKGELVSIALKAMKTHPKLRHGSVREFQQAVRDYLSHSESVLLSDRAAEHLRQARHSAEYHDFNRALFGFQQAIELWDGNSAAVGKLAETRLAYAETARNRGDFDLGAGLLDLTVPQHIVLHGEITEAAHQRELRQRRAKTYQRLGIGLALVLFSVVSGAAVWINAERQEALFQKGVAEQKQQEADENFHLAEQRREQVEVERDNVESQRKIAVANAEEAERQASEAKRQKGIAEDNEQKAVTAAAEAMRQKGIAEDNMLLAQQNEAAAVRARKAEAYEAYVARIGSAAARIEERAFDRARELLQQCVPKATQQTGQPYAVSDVDHRGWEWYRLWYLCHQAAATYDTPFPITCLAADYDSDGNLTRFAAAGEDGSVEIRTGTGDILQSIKTAEHSPVSAVAFSPDNQRIVVGCRSGSRTLQAFDIRSGKPINNGEHGTGTAGAGERDSGTLGTREPGVLSLRYSADGRLLLTSCTDGTVRIRDARDDRILSMLHGHRRGVSQAIFLPADASGKPVQLVSAGLDGEAVVWTDESGDWSDTDTIRRSPPFSRHSGPIYAVDASPDGRTIATAGHDQRILLWNTDSLKPFDFERAVANDDYEFAQDYTALEGHTAVVRTLQFSRDGKRLVSAGHDNAVHVWNIAENRTAGILQGHGQWVTAVCLSPDDRTVLSAGLDAKVMTWNTQAFSDVTTFRTSKLEGQESSVLDAKYSPSAQQIAMAGRNGTVSLWQTSTGEPLKILREGHSYLAAKADFSPDGRRLATTAVDDTTRIWDAQTGAELHVLRDTGRSAVASFSADGRRIATGSPAVRSEERSVWGIKIWNAETGELEQTLHGHSAAVSAVCWSPDGRFLFTGDAAGGGLLWDAKSFRRIRPLNWHSAGIIAAEFIDDETLLTAAAEKSVARWSVEAGAVDETQLLMHPDAITAMDTDSQGRWVVTACRDNTVRVWDSAAGNVIREIQTTTDTAGTAAAVSAVAVTSVAVTADGRRIVLADSARRRVRLFDAENGEELLFPDPAGRPGPFLQLASQSQLRSVLFSPDETSVLTVGGDQVRLWKIDPGALPFRRLKMSCTPLEMTASVSYSPDGKRLISGSRDGTAVIWNVDDGRSVVRLVGAHRGPVNGAVFSPAESDPVPVL